MTGKTSCRCGRESDDHELIEACTSHPPLYVSPKWQTGCPVDLVVEPGANGSTPQFRLASDLVSAQEVIVRGFVDTTLEGMEGDIQPQTVRLTLGQPAHQWHLIHRLMLCVQVDWQDQRYLAVVPTPRHHLIVFLRLLD